MAPMPETIEVLSHHRFDEARLAEYLQQRVPELSGPFRVGQFQGGQSNPTFLLTFGTRHLVLRKKPPGDLLRGAHQVEREFKVMAALQGSPVPVPQMHLLCEDPEVIGTPFFLMDFVLGRFSAEPNLPEFNQKSRKPAWLAMASTLGALHNVDWRAVGLEAFGRPDGYIARQLKTWSRQYEASKTEEMPAMDKLMKKLGENVPEEDTATIVHGDFRPGNMIFADDSDEVAAVLDWELSTIGHPLADLGYLLMPYRVPGDVPGVKGVQGLDLDAEGLPSREEIVGAYASARGISQPDNLDYFSAFALFRLTAIVQGVYARALQGNASHADALAVGKRAGFLAECGWALASRF